MLIYVHTDDTFTADGVGKLYQHRTDNSVRIITPTSVGPWFADTKTDRKAITRDAAIAWLRDGLGHTITDNPFGLAVVPRPTHCVKVNLTGFICQIGTEEDCKRYVGTQNDKLFTMYPFADESRAPMSAEQRECWTLMQTWLRENFNRASGLQLAIEKMLKAEGGEAR